MATQIVFWIGWFVVVAVLWSVLLAIYLKG
jgi:hypothetical protein